MGGFVSIAASSFFPALCGENYQGESGTRDDGARPRSGTTVVASAVRCDETMRSDTSAGLSRLYPELPLQGFQLMDDLIEIRSLLVNHVLTHRFIVGPIEIHHFVRR